jgi:hypothetical protein
MFCSKCGRAADGSAFCVGCGASMQTTSEPAPAVMPPPVVVQTQYQQPQAFQNNYAPQQSYLPPQQQPYMSAPQTNGKAIASLVLSLLGISILGVIFGHIASSEIKNSGGRQGGSGLATAGIVLGWLGMVGWVFYWIFFAALFSSSMYYY